MLLCRTYRLDWNRRESLDGALTTLLNHHFLDGTGAGPRRQPSAALSHVYPGPTRRSGLYRPRPSRRPAAALSVAERARIAPTMEASPVQAFGPGALGSAAVRPNTPKKSHGLLVTLNRPWRVYRLGWSTWEALYGVSIALLNPQLLDDECSDRRSQQAPLGR